jgi:hypothetical protein
MGLISLASEPDLGSPDVVIIEYAVNDYALIAAGQQDVWQAAYEGLVRQVSRRWSSALICCVILGRSDSQKARWDVISEGTHAIAAHYPNACVIDCPSILSEYTMSAESSDVYDDPLHYSESTRTAAGYLIAAAITAATQPVARELPEPINADVLDPVSIIDFPTLFPNRREAFTNSVVTADCLKIAAGDEISVDVPGRIIAVSFVSRLDGGSFLMTWNGQSALVHTLHDQVGNGKFPFLPLSAVGNWWRGPSEAGTLTIAPISEQIRAADWPVYHVGPNAHADAPIYLHQALVRAK